MKVIFKRTDFKLCKVPVPEGYMQSQTHSGIAIHNGSYYLTTSPYPNYKQPRWKTYMKAGFNKIMHWGKIQKTKPAEQYENPCLYLGMSNKNAPPVEFRLLQSSPLMPPPDPYYDLPAYNSDPDIFIEKNEIHVLNRSFFRKRICNKEPLNKHEIRLYHIHGIIDEKRFKYVGTELLLETEHLFVSPCLTKYKDNYILSELESNAYNDGETFNGLFITKASNIKDFKNENLTWEKVKVTCNNIIPWHMSLFQYDGTLYTIMACVKKGIGHRLWQMLGEFNKDLTKLEIFEIPLTDYKSYRGAACVNKDGEFILYSTTVREKISKGNSVDGREVIMAHAPFKEVLRRLHSSKEPDSHERADN